MRKAWWTTCRCGKAIVVLDTRRGKRIGVNQEPQGHDAYRYRGPNRLEDLYIYGTHQPHVATCTKPRTPAERERANKKKFV